MKKSFLLTLCISSVLFLGCSEQSKEEMKEKTNESIDKVAEVTQDTVEKTHEVVKTVTETTSTIVEDVKKEATPIVEKMVERSQEVVEEVSKSASDMSQNLQKKIVDMTESKIDAKGLYGRCASCHGKNGEKKALNSSAVIQGWSEEKVFAALKGYQNGTYGGNMKGVMTGQVKSFSEDELRALSEFISTF